MDPLVVMVSPRILITMWNVHHRDRSSKNQILGVATYAIRPLGPLDVSDRQWKSVSRPLMGTQEQIPSVQKGVSDRQIAVTHLQPMVYTTRDRSQPAPITADCTGYRVPAIRSEVR